MNRTSGLVIVDYKAGNLRSVELSLAHLGSKAEVSADPERIRSADRVIFPGVGGADSAMIALRSNGIDSALREVYQSGKPMLGICVGCQVIFDFSEEGPISCMGLVSGRVNRLQSSPNLKVPHMGWNVVHQKQWHPIVNDVVDGARFYFVHSYCVLPDDSSTIVGATWYGQEFASIVALNNIVGTQFHAEKSGRWGLKVLSNFLQWNP